jgi:pimeloyl-ACP methyl ester carboxylesterase
MGGSVAMKTAELDGSRLDALVLIDVAGRVDPGIGPVITSVMDQLSESYDSIDAYLAAVRGQGLVEPWTEHWERAHRYQLLAVDGRVRARLDPAAVAEDRAYTATQHPYDRWRHLTMSTLLLRATQELSPGAGHVVPADDRDRFLREVRDSTVVEIDANHLTINTHPNTVAAINTFLGTSRP